MFLYDWAERKAKSDKVEDIIGKLQGFKKDLGQTLRGKPLLIDLYKFAKLDASKMINQDLKKLENETESERSDREKRMLKKQEEKLKQWKDTKEQIYKEADDKELENIAKTNIVARFIKSEDKQMSKTNINYQIAKDESPKAIKLNIGE